MAAKDEAGIRELSRGYMFVIRALQSHDHLSELIPLEDTGAR